MSDRVLVVLCLALFTVLAGVPASAQTTILKVPGDADTIQGAVDMAGPDTTILVSKGEYAEAVLIQGKSDLTLIGKGKPILMPGIGATAISVDGGDGVVIQGFRIRDVLNGVVISASTEVTVAKCLIENAIERGILAYDASFLTIEKNTLKGIGEDGLDIGDIPGVTDCTVIKNKLDGIGNHGILIGGDRNHVEKNKVSNTGGYGLETRSLVSSNDNVFLKNRLKLIGSVGMLSNGTGNLFESNKLATSGEEGVRLTATATGNTFRNNKLGKPGAEGVVLLGDGNTITGCKVSGAAADGFAVSGNANTLEANKSSKAGGDGFHVTGTGNTFTGNGASGSGDLDLEDENGVGPNTYIDNKFKTSNLGP